MKGRKKTRNPTKENQKYIKYIFKLKIVNWQIYIYVFVPLWQGGNNSIVYYFEFLHFIHIPKRKKGNFLKLWLHFFVSLSPLSFSFHWPVTCVLQWWSSVEFAWIYMHYYFSASDHRTSSSIQPQQQQKNSKSKTFTNKMQVRQHI